MGHLRQLFSTFEWLGTFSKVQHIGKYYEGSDCLAHLSLNSAWTADQNEFKKHKNKSFSKIIY